MHSVASLVCLKQTPKWKASVCLYFSAGSTVAGQSAGMQNPCLEKLGPPPSWWLGPVAWPNIIQLAVLKSLTCTLESSSGMPLPVAGIIVGLLQVDGGVGVRSLPNIATSAFLMGCR